LCVRSRTQRNAIGKQQQQQQPQQRVNKNRPDIGLNTKVLINHLIEYYTMECLHTINMTNNVGDVVNAGQPEEGTGVSLL